MSSGEQAIETILNCLGLGFIHDKPLECLDNDKLRPDFVLEGYKIVIEYQGERHFLDGYKEKAEDVYQKDVEKYRDLVSHGYTVLYAVFPEITKDIEFPENYIDTLYTTQEELRNKLIELTNKKVMVKELDKIYKSNDLSFAKKCPQNRDIKNSQVKKILSGLENGQWWRLFYFVVDIDTDELIDGHHRLVACEEYVKKHGKLDQPIKYYYLKRNPGVSMPEMIKIFNEDRSNMSSKDNLKLVEYMGNTAIPIIRDFGQKNKLTQRTNRKGEVVGYNEAITYAFIYGQPMNDKVKNNTISITDEELQNAQNRITQVENILTAINCPDPDTFWLRTVVSAWYDLTVKDDLFKSSLIKTTFSDFCNQLSIDCKSWPAGEKWNKDIWKQRFSSTLNNTLNN